MGNRLEESGENDWEDEDLDEEEEARQFLEDMKRKPGDLTVGQIGMLMIQAAEETGDESVGWSFDVEGNFIAQGSEAVRKRFLELIAKAKAIETGEAN